MRNNEAFDFVGRAWPTDSTLGTPVILFGNQLAVPTQQCVRRHEIGNFVQYPTADKFGFRCQATALIIGKPEPTIAKLLSQDPILFAQVIDRMLLFLVHPSGDGNDEEPESIENVSHLRRPLSPLAVCGKRPGRSESATRIMSN